MSVKVTRKESPIAGIEVIDDHANGFRILVDKRGNYWTICVITPNHKAAFEFDDDDFAKFTDAVCEIRKA